MNRITKRLTAIRSRQMVDLSFDMNAEIRDKIEKRTEALFDAQRLNVFIRTDRLFAGLLLFEWIAGIFAAIWISPKTWVGQDSHVHIHVWAAIFLGAVIISMPIFLAIKRPGIPLTRHAIAVSQMLTSALLIHLTGGRIETHFHVFGSLAFLAFYGDWRVIISASIVVGLDHMLRGIFWPQSVFGVLTASNWRWLEHAGWVVFEDIFLIIACLRTVTDTDDMARQQAQLEAINANIENKVKERTAMLDRKNDELDRKNDELAEKVNQLKESQKEMVEKNEELAKKNEELVESYKQADRIFSALAEALPGTVLDGKYRLETKIGSGGFGAVYRASHLSLNRPVAIKVFRPTEENATMENLDRFRLEGVSTCRVNHPNAVSVLDSGISSEGIAYLVMELLEGHSLVEELQREGMLSVKRCAEILIPVCNVLAEAHQNGIIHRDIKPDNIFLHQAKEGEIVKVVDFGIAKFVEKSPDLEAKELTGTGNLVGTPTYMAPERLSNKPYDGKSDVYSVGILMYQILSGTVPFDSMYNGIVGLILSHLKEDPPPLRDLNSSVPESIESLVMRALAKDPSKRPTAKEMSEEFALALGITIEPMVTGSRPIINRYDSGEVSLNPITSPTQDFNPHYDDDEQTIEANSTIKTKTELLEGIGELASQLALTNNETKSTK